MIDTHCHLTYEPLATELSAVLQRAKDAGVHRMITVGTSPEDSLRACEVARRHPQVRSSAGLHPQHSHEWRDKARLQSMLREVAEQGEVVAWGELGLDKHYAEPAIEVQREALDWQLEVIAASGRKLPIIIHNREATDETLAVLRGSGLPGERFVFHCFTGTRAELDAILAFGAMVSYTGIVTFKSAVEIAACADATPNDRVMIETDSPYLTPEPYRKVKVNEPCYVPWVAKFLAPRRGMTVAEFEQATDANAVRFFGL